MKNNIFNKWTPKEFKFFPMLNDLSNVTTEMSRLVVECLGNYSYIQTVEYNKKIKLLERDGDIILAKIFEALHTTFITPFDREDIHSLANMLDDIADYINNFSRRIVMYHPKQMPANAKHLADLLLEATGNLYNAVNMLPTLKEESNSIKKCCETLHSIENQADDIYEGFIIDLFEHENDAIEVIKLKEILHELEDAIDAAEDAGNIIKTIIVKYA